MVLERCIGRRQFGNYPCTQKLSCICVPVIGRTRDRSPTPMTSLVEGVVKSAWIQKAKMKMPTSAASIFSHNTRQKMCGLFSLCQMASLQQYVVPAFPPSTLSISFRPLPTPHSVFYQHPILQCSDARNGHGEKNNKNPTRPGRNAWPGGNATSRLGKQAKRNTVLVMSTRRGRIKASFHYS